MQVLERAKEGEGLEELRARTAAQFHGSEGERESKRRKGAEAGGGLEVEEV